MAKEPTKAQQAKIDELLAESKALCKERKYEEALAKAEQVLTINSDDVNAMVAMSESLYELKRSDEAIAILDKAIGINPDNDEAWSDRGAAKSQLGQYEDAIKDCDEAIRLNPDNAAAWNNRATAKDDLGQHEAAIKDCDEAIRLNPDNDAAWNNRGLAKGKLGQHEEAIKDFDEAIRLKRDNAIAWNNRGLAKSSLGQHEDAIEDLDQAIRLNPNSDHAWNNRGTTKAYLEDFEGAIKDIKKAIELNPDNVQLRANLAGIEAGRNTQKEINERIGSYIISSDGIKEERKYLEGAYEKRKRERDFVAYGLVIIVGIFVFGPIFFLIIYALSANDCETPKVVAEICYWTCCENTAFNFDFNNFDKTLLAYWSILTLTVSAPFLILLKLKSRDAEEAKILSHDYLRMEAIEARIHSYQSHMPPEMRHKLMEQQIDNWTLNSPVNTLIRYRKNAKDDAAKHPLESMFAKFCERFRTKNKETDSSPKP